MAVFVCVRVCGSVAGEESHGDQAGDGRLRAGLLHLPVPQGPQHAPGSPAVQGLGLLMGHTHTHTLSCENIVEQLVANANEAL